MILALKNELLEDRRVGSKSGPYRLQVGCRWDHRLSIAVYEAACLQHGWKAKLGNAFPAASPPDETPSSLAGTQMPSSSTEVLLYQTGSWGDQSKEGSGSPARRAAEDHCGSGRGKFELVGGRPASAATAPAPRRPHIRRRPRVTTSKSLAANRIGRRKDIASGRPGARQQGRAIAPMVYARQDNDGIAGPQLHRLAVSPRRILGALRDWRRFCCCRQAERPVASDGTFRAAR